MQPIIALLLCVVIVKFLLRIERRRNPEVTAVLWLPTIWIILNASKPIARWLNSGPHGQLFLSQETGSPYDRLVLLTLIILSLLVLYKRKIEWFQILGDNFWLILLYLYLGSSILWSDFPFVSFKRWFRLCGAIPVAMVVLSERYPLKALESIFRRCVYVLIPFSLLLIKYYPHLGVQYVSWSGAKMWVGVASQKNGLGALCALAVFLIIWTHYREWRSGTLFKRRSQAFADGLILAISFFLLQGYRGVYSATSIGVLIIGLSSLLLLYQMKKSIRIFSTFMVCAVAIVLISLPFADSLVTTGTSAFSRNASFTGRTDIWKMVLDVASRNPILGVGYGGFWGLKDEMIHSTVGVREAHSGYLDVYLEVGLVGVVLLMAFLFTFYRKALRELNYARDWALFGISFFLMNLFQNYTESSFLRTSSFYWNIMVFLAIAFSTPNLRINRGQVYNLQR